MAGVAFVAVALIAVVFIDTFDTMILPRRVRHSYRLARLYYFSAWFLWRTSARMLPSGRWRHSFLSVFGPLSLLGLVIVWATGLIFGFALLHWSLGTALSFAHEADSGFIAYLYFSGTTFFTLGYGDLVPTGVWGRLGASPERSGSRHRFRLPGDDHQLSASALPGVLAPRDNDFAS
jgi:hypothetical protein